MTTTDGEAVAGIGTELRPFSRGGRCAYLGCPESAIKIRTSHSGLRILYCGGHFDLAMQVFDTPSRAAA